MVKRLKRRIGSARASVMLEFAFVAPLVIFTIAFAADFTRIIRTEQQLEIATRLAADVEAHMADYYKEGYKSPCSETKNVAKKYLADVAHVVSGTGDVYMKGKCETISNPISMIVAKFKQFLDGEGFTDDANFFVRLIGKILGGIMNFVTFRTFNYLIDVVPHDREVCVTTAAYIPTVLPTDVYKWLPLPEHQSGKIGVGQFTVDLEGGPTAWNLKINAKKRHRVYCHMPVIDSVPIAPETYVRVFKSWCAKQPFLKGLVK